MMIVVNRPVLPKVVWPFTGPPQLSFFSPDWYSSNTDVMTQGPMIASLKFFS